MNREIKFRVYLGGKFFYWGFINGSFVGLPMSTEEQLTMQELEDRSQQYTGLRDKNGTPIFEGDVIETDFPSFPRGFVKYSSYTCAYVLAMDGYPLFFISDLVRNKWKLEVIGSIHEHPELLNSTTNAPL